MRCINTIIAPLSTGFINVLFIIFSCNDTDAGLNPILRGLFRPRKRGGWQNCHPYTNCCSTGPIVFKLGQNIKLSRFFKFLEKKSKFLMTSSLFFGKNVWNFFLLFFFFLEMIFKHKTIFFFFWWHDLANDNKDVLTFGIFHLNFSQTFVI